MVLEDKEFPNAGVNADFAPKGLLSILLLGLTMLLFVIVLLIELLLKPICLLADKAGFAPKVP